MDADLTVGSWPCRSAVVGTVALTDAWVTVRSPRGPVELDGAGDPRPLEHGATYACRAKTAGQSWAFTGRVTHIVRGQVVHAERQPPRVRIESTGAITVRDQGRAEP